jgi:Tol biopolymer transport system component
MVKARSLVGIGLTVGLISLAACSGSSGSQNKTGPASPPSTNQSSATAPTTGPTPLAAWPNPGKNGQIAFGRWLDAAQTTRAIFVINPDGTGEQQLTHPAPGVVDNNPDWSPDRSKISFERCSDHCEAWVMNADGSGARSLGVDCPGVNCDSGAPAWSPDGETLASNRAYGPIENDTIKFSELVLIDARTGRMIRRIDATAPYSGDTGEAGWSPDGRQLVFTRVNSSTGEPPNARAVFVANSDGTGRRRLTPWDLNGGDHPVWSPDGRLILFRTVSGPDDNYGNLYTVHPDGTGLHQLTHYDATTIVLSYSFSPDGRWITFAKEGVGGEPDIFLMRLGGTDLAPVTQTALADSAPDWGPAE